MMSFRFVINSRGRLTIRLRNNNKKTEISFPRQIYQEELDAVLIGKTKKLESVERRNLRLLVSQYTAYLERLSAQLLVDGNARMDVMEIRSKFERHFKLVPEAKEAAVGTFVTQFKKFIDGKTNRGTKEVYKYTLDKIHAFDPDIDKKSFEDITLQWLTDFENFCARTASKNARNIHLRNIRAVFNNAIDYEITAAYPFRRFKIHPEATRKRSLTVEDLRKLFSYPVEEYAVVYRDMFKLIFMFIGINTVDLHALESVTPEGRIEYKRAKTGRLYSIKVEPEAMELINKYKGEKGLLCIADRWSDSRNFRHQCNKALQLIGAKKNKGGRLEGGNPKKTDKTDRPKGIWPELTTYWARHSWATIAYSIGISKDVIAQALGHGGNTVTDIYIDKDQALVDDANRRVLDWVLYSKK